MFVETIYDAIVDEAVEHQTLGAVIELLIELEKLRLELEDNDACKSVVAPSVNMGSF